MLKIQFPDYTRSIVNMMASLRKHYGLDIFYPTLKELDEELTKNYKNIVIILLDGMGSNIISNSIGSNNFFTMHKRCNYLSIFPPTTVAATTALLSTKTPIEHGWLGWHCYFKELDKDLNMFSSTGYYEEYKHYESASNKYMPYLSVLDELKTVGVKTFDLYPSFKEGGSKTFDEMLNKLEIKLKEDNSKKFAYCYWEQPDHDLHDFGCTSSEVRNTIQELNDKLEAFYKSRLDNDTLVIVTADHGHVDVLNINLLGYPKILKCLERLPSIEPRASAFYVKKGKEKEFEEEFNSLWKDDFILLTKEEVLKQNIFGVGTPHPTVESTLGDYIAIAKGRYMFSVYDDCFKATHAGITEDEMLIPLILLSKK